MSARHAALAIHALSDVDRQWMLDRLPPVERDVLAPLLAELRELGIPRDVRPLAPVPSEAPTSAPMPGAPSDLDWLAGLPGAVVVPGLVGESPEVVARLLACHEWPWAAEVAVAMSVQLPAPLPVPAPRLRDTLCRELAMRLRAGMAEREMISDTRPSPSMQGRRPVGSWLKRWTGRPA